MANTMMKKMVGYAAAAIILGTLAIGTIFATGAGNLSSKTVTKNSTVSYSLADDNSQMASFRTENKNK